MPETVVDDLDILEAAPAACIDEFLLSGLAFEIGLDLRLRGLDDIEHHLAPQHPRGKKIGVVIVSLLLCGTRCLHQEDG
ncbi:hypothetical protein [Methylocella silvestris]|uniref:hypothetical protein n=1 Tax=Methylocella silvestris TaxID=199596 RepID=UPI00165045D0|nr:hypothetical protein [Methylocella silvestris]